MSSSEEQYTRLNSYKTLFSKKIASTIEQYNEQSIEFFKTRLSKIIKNIQDNYKEKQDASSSETEEETFIDFLNSQIGDEIDKMSIGFNTKYKREVKNTLDSELTTFLNKTLFMIFDI